MSQELDRQIADLRARVNEAARMKETLPSRREELTQHNYRLELTQLAIGELQADIQALEALTPAAIMASLLGRKELKVADKREQLARLQIDCDELVRKVASIRQEVESCEDAVAESSQWEETCRSLCAQKQSSILESGDPRAVELQQLTTEADRLREEKRRLERAIESGGNAIERLETLTRSLGRTRAKMVHRGPGAGVINAIARQGSAGFNERVRDGLDRLCKSLDELSETETPQSEYASDVELLRLIGEVQAHRSNLASGRLGGMFCDTRFALPVMQDIQALVGHLSDQVSTREARIAEIERRAGDLVAMA